MSASHSIRANCWPAFAPSCADRSTSRVRLHRLVYLFEGFQAEVDTRRVVASDGAEIPLTAAEFDLLLVFLQRPGRVLTRDYFLDQTQGKAALRSTVRSTCSSAAFATSSATLGGSAC